VPVERRVRDEEHHRDEGRHRDARDDAAERDAQEQQDTERQIDRPRLVKKMKPLGFSLDEMRAMFDAREALEDAAGDAGGRDAARATIASFAGQVDERTAKMRVILEQSEGFARELRDVD
jgi:hypothetical protein